MLTARQKKTLEIIAAKLAAARENLAAEEAKILAAMGQFSDVRTKVEDEARRGVKDNRERFRRAFDGWRSRIAEAGRAYNEVAEDTFPDEGLGVDDYELEQLAEDLDDDQLASLVEDFGGEDAAEQHLIEFDPKGTKGLLRDVVKREDADFAEALRDAKQDPDAYLEGLDDPAEFLGEEDYEAWQEGLDEEH